MIRVSCKRRKLDLSRFSCKDVVCLLSRLLPLADVCNMMLVCTKWAYWIATDLEGWKNRLSRIEGMLNVKSNDILCAFALKMRCIQLTMCGTWVPPARWFIAMIKSRKRRMLYILSHYFKQRVVGYGAGVTPPELEALTLSNISLNLDSNCTVYMVFLEQYVCFRYAGKGVAWTRVNYATLLSPFRYAYCHYAC